MATTRLMISTGVQGNMIGAIFDDGLIIKHDTNVALTRIIVDHGLYINSLTVSYPFYPSPILAENLTLIRCTTLGAILQLHGDRPKTSEQRSFSDLEN